MSDTNVTLILPAGGTRTAEVPDDVPQYFGPNGTSAVHVTTERAPSFKPNGASSSHPVSVAHAEAESHAGSPVAGAAVPSRAWT